MISFVNSMLLNGQVQKDTIYFNSKWELSDRSGFQYFRTYEKSGAVYKIIDHYKNGKLQMTTTSDIPNPLNKNGVTVYYNEEGFRTAVGHESNNKDVGHWVWYYKNETDSSVADYNSDGTKNYTRIYEGEKAKGEVYTVVEEMPEYPGGIKEMMVFIQKNILYPSYCREKSLGGKVFIKFVVNNSGDIENVTIIKSTGVFKLDEEALRVVKLMPKWKPGYQNGKAVSVYFNLPVNFSIDSPYFIFNTFNKNPSYVVSQEPIKFGVLKDVIQSFKGEMDSSAPDLDVLYNLGVAYFVSKEKKEACRCFKKITDLSNDNVNMISNCKKYLEKYCN